MNLKFCHRLPLWFALCVGSLQAALLQGQVGSIEVNKSLLPEMDADAIGGQVDLKTRTAKSESPEFGATLAGGYNPEMESFQNFEGGLTYAQRFGKLGVTVGASLSQRHQGSDNVEFSYADLPVYVHEDSVNLGLDYELGKESKLWMSAWYNMFSDQEYRRRLRLRFGKGEIFASDTTLATGTAVYRDLKDRYEEQHIWSVAAGGEHSRSPRNLLFCQSRRYPSHTAW